jgi:hypothetical protein
MIFFVTWWILCGIAASGVSITLMIENNKAKWGAKGVLAAFLGSFINILFGPGALIGAVIMLKEYK